MFIGDIFFFRSELTRSKVAIAGSDMLVLLLHNHSLKTTTMTMMMDRFELAM
jgi:hypothetical protein